MKKKKTNETLMYISSSNGVNAIITLPYLERRNVKFMAKDVLNKKFKGCEADLSWSAISKKWIDIYKGAVDILLEANVEIYLYNGGVQDIIKNSKADRIYVSDLSLADMSKDVYFVRKKEAVLIQLASLVSGFYGFLDILANNPESESAKAELARYALNKGLDGKIQYLSN